MRVKLTHSALAEFFPPVLKIHGSWGVIAKMCGVSKRTLYDWKAGRHSIPLAIFERLVESAHMDKGKFRHRVLPNFWHTSFAGRKGALVHQERYGNLGTAEGRRRGGFASLKVHGGKSTGFILKKPIIKPQKSEMLAELLGILFGDGHLSQYQVSVTTNLETDFKHAVFVKKLIQDLFSVSASILKRLPQNTVNILASSRALVEFISGLGMPVGNKLKRLLRIPAWILSRPVYKRAFIRGLFDTDGCIYLEVRRRKSKIYRYLGWTITSYSNPLLCDIVSVLSSLGFTPAHTETQRSVYLRKQEEVERYFSLIDTHNSKHRQRYRSFMERKNRHGEVPKRS